MNFEIYKGDALNIKNIIKKKVHFVCIDPPYGISKMGEQWSDDFIKNETIKSTGVVKGLPRGMKFDKKTSKNIGDFIYDVSKNIIDIMYPGSFLVVFTQPRCSHRVGVALEDVGFELRDLLSWNYGCGQCKAQGMQNFIKKSKNIINKQEIIKLCDGYKTPQLTPTYENMWL